MTFAPPVDALNHGHPTLWGNLGDWSHTSEYVEAARALARRLGDAAGLGPGHRMVDLGSGAGDQLRMWVESFGVEHVTAVELDPGLARRAAERVTAWGLDSCIDMVVGEATTARWTDTAVDRVVALDSAYFFESRESFLRRCRWALRPEGVLAVTDLLLGEGVPARMAGAVAPIFGISRGDFLTELRYRALLTENGFHHIHVHDCTDQVLGGFSRWIRSGGHRRGRASAVTTRMGLSMTAWAAWLLARPTGLRYVVTTACRRSP
ncbi:MAG: class I SAM-dependent methyltransferase [Gemmatimonadales bacterium]|nr:MAG: class I SAM-dependent methyltransferase [Gemmatimonadales bacterium]